MVCSNVLSFFLFRSDLGWLAEAGEGCDLGLEDEATCDPRDHKVCSYYSPCDNKTTKPREHPVTKHSYCKCNLSLKLVSRIINVPLISDDCCVKVSAHQLLNHWLNDHKDPEPMGNNNDQEVLHIVNCQSPESSLSAALARLQSTESTGKSKASNILTTAALTLSLDTTPS